MATEGTLSQAPIKIQDFRCISDLCVIPLGGCDAVLGVQWLKTLVPILWVLINCTWSSLIILRTFLYR